MTQNIALMTGQSLVFLVNVTTRASRKESVWLTKGPQPKETLGLTCVQSTVGQERAGKLLDS